eukprot:scaffold176667_cov21-Tisochrysis_lutea.AAC.2
MHPFAKGTLSKNPPCQAPLPGTLPGTPLPGTFLSTPFPGALQGTLLQGTLHQEIGSSKGAAKELHLTLKFLETSGTACATLLHGTYNTQHGMFKWTALSADHSTDVKETGMQALLGHPKGARFARMPDQKLIHGLILAPLCSRMPPAPLCS